MEVFGQTDVGCVRPLNQDAVAARVFGDDLAAAAVCDGMGGAKSGEVASDIALSSFMSDIEDALSSGKMPIGAADTVAAAVAKAGAAVQKRAALDPECEGMGTTLVAAVVIGNNAIIANVGDSRAYHISDGSILRVTRDHSVVEDMVARGEITFDEARHHPSRNLITRVLGSAQREEADIFLVGVRQGDLLLLCSDGLSNLMLGDEILEFTQNRESTQKICEELINEALARGAPDNVTVAVIAV